jgi:hypothetical protein
LRLGIRTRSEDNQAVTSEERESSKRKVLFSGMATAERESLRRKTLFQGGVVGLALFAIFVVFRVPLNQPLNLPDIGETPLMVLLWGVALFVLGVGGLKRRRRRAKKESERTRVSKLPINPT